MRQVQPGPGKITKSIENAEKLVMETIVKKPKPQEQPKPSF
jgi:tyrosine-protein phosphatase YwqE